MRTQTGRNPSVVLSRLRQDCFLQCAGASDARGAGDIASLLGAGVCLIAPAFCRGAEKH
jgi:hypothetical protein